MFQRSVPRKLVSIMNQVKIFFTTIHIVINFCSVGSLTITAPQSKVVVIEGDTEKIRWSVNTNEEVHQDSL